MDTDPNPAYDHYSELEDNPSDNSISDNSYIQKISTLENKFTNSTHKDSLNASLAFETFLDEDKISGFEPVLGGQLREKAIWVDEASCIGCQYCVHVANNTFIVDETLGRSRVIRQNGDNPEIVQEAIDTCPVDCIHWVDFEDLEKLDTSLNRDMFQSLGKLPRVNRY